MMVANEKWLPYNQQASKQLTPNERNKTTAITSKTKGQLLALASELHPWRFELEIFPSRLPCGHVFEPKLNAQQGAICEAFFLEML